MTECNFKQYDREPEEKMTSKNNDALEDLPEWADFERVDHDSGEITYESHGREGGANREEYVSDTFIVISGVRAKTVAETIRTALQAQSEKDKKIETLGPVSCGGGSGGILKNINKGGGGGIIKDTNNHGGGGGCETDFMG